MPPRTATLQPRLCPITVNMLTGFAGYHSKPWKSLWISCGCICAYLGLTNRLPCSWHQSTIVYVGATPVRSVCSPRFKSVKEVHSNGIRNAANRSRSVTYDEKHQP